jgi:hypothetical protein
MGAFSSTKNQVTHGTVVCDGGACNHSACVVHQCTDDDASGSHVGSVGVEVGRHEETKKSSHNLTLVCTTIRLPHQYTDEATNTTKIPNTTAVTSDYHTLSDTATAKPEDVPKVKPAKGTSANGTPSSSHMLTSAKEGFCHRPSQLSVVPTTMPAEPEETKHPLLTTSDEQSFFKRLGTTLPSQYMPFKALKDPDPGGGEGSLQVESFEMQLAHYCTPESINTTVEPQQAQ